MAKQEADTATIDMFSAEDKLVIVEALEAYTATMRRKINTEKNEQIKKIYQQQMQTILNAQNKTAGWI